MAINSTEGRTMIGFIVQGDDNSPDPQGLGRVKILTASNHPDTDPSKLPWSQVTSPASGSGPNAFNRPPPMGSVVEIYFPPGTKSSGHGIVRSVLHGVHNPDNLDNQNTGQQDKQNFTKTGWLNEARNTRPKNASGPGTFSQGGGGTGGTTVYKPAPSLEDRVGTDTSGASKGFIRTNKGMVSVASASQWNYFMHDPQGVTGQPTVQLPGQDPNFSQKCSGWSTSKELLTKGLQNMSKLRPDYVSDNTGMNFCYQGNKTGGGYDGAASGRLSGVSTQQELMDAIHEVNTWDFYDNILQQEGDRQVNFKAAFDKVEVVKKISPSGHITIETKDAIQEQSKKFNEKVIGGGVSVGKTTGSVKKDKDEDTGQPKLKLEGGLFSGSGTKGPSGDLMLKLNIETQKKVKKALHDFAIDPNQFAINFQFARFGAGEGCTRDPEPDQVSMS